MCCSYFYSYDYFMVNKRIWWDKRMGYIISRRVFEIFYLTYWILSEFLYYSYLSYSTVAVLCGILPLIVPNSNPFKSIVHKNISYCRIFFFINRKLEIWTNYSMERSCEKYSMGCSIFTWRWSRCCSSLYCVYFFSI